MEQFKRLELVIGKDNLNKLNSSTILVLGLGGVGSYVVESLVRSGVGSLILVDFDNIDITNLNRQLMTNLNNINELKTEVFLKRIKEINPNCKVKLINNFIDDKNINLLFDERIDYLIDCCDTVLTKKLVIENCLYKKIPFITCMGTGNKLDPSKLQIIDIRKTAYDPLAKVIRKWVKEENILSKIPCCCSTEKPTKNKENIIGSTAFVPSSAGLLITSYIVRKIISK